MLAVFAVAGAAIGVALVPRAPSPPDPNEPPPALFLAGQRLELVDGAIERALGILRRYVAGSLVLSIDGEHKRTFRLSALGAAIDKARISKLVRDARDPASPLRRALGTAPEERTDLVLPIVVDPERALTELLLLKDAVDRQPADARLDLARRTLVPEVVGRLLDVDATLAALQKAVERGERDARAIFEDVPPKRRAEDLKDVRFDRVLGYFETPYDRSQKYEARSYNLRLAAAKLDGYVLLPGQVFDFNEVVGPRDEANGYKVAKVIAEGELVDGIGGGTCQISGTVHGAAFFAGLDVVERYPHTRPSSYIKMGLDATVVYPTINFRLKNPYDFPVVLHQTVKEGVVRAEILGGKQPYTVTLIRRIEEAIPYEELERPDPDLPDGLRLLAQRGVPGFKLHRYRIVRDDAHAVRQRWNDVYPPTAQIVRVGTGPGPRDRVQAHDDKTAEYVADELLTVTQGPDIRKDGKPDMLEQREPGEFGRYGWTERAGMPFWKGESGS
jgi:vancomycin resistance protein YoaR